MTNQRRSDGSLRNLIRLEALSRAELGLFLDRSEGYVPAAGERAPRNRALAGLTIGTLFPEPSTRPRVSFELAGRRLGAEVINLEVQLSSRVKGETMLDTIHTLEALHFDAFVIRDSEPGVVAHVAANVASHVSVFSAGEAHLSHPTQGLLDALTVRQCKGEHFEHLCVAIVGDVRHSRVARSAYEVFTALGVGELRLVAPPGLMPPAGEVPAGQRCLTLEEGLRGADVGVMLRVQKERNTQAGNP